MQLHRVSQTFHEPPVVEGLGQEVDRSVIDRTSPVFVVWVSGNQNHWHLISTGPQCFLQLKPTLPRQFQVSDRACCPCHHSRLEEPFRRCESGGGVAKGLDKLANAVAGQFVIIHDRDEWSSGHPWSPRRNVPQLRLQNHNLYWQNLTWLKYRSASPMSALGQKQTSELALRHAHCSSSGSLAMFAAIRRASSRVSGLGQCPLYPQKRTSELNREMSAKCQKRTSAIHLYGYLPGCSLKVIVTSAGDDPLARMVCSARISC
jgi:hypothetical protein